MYTIIEIKQEALNAMWYSSYDSEYFTSLNAIIAHIASTENWDVLNINAISLTHMFVVYVSLA